MKQTDMLTITYLEKVINHRVKNYNISYRDSKVDDPEYAKICKAKAEELTDLLRLFKDSIVDGHKYV